MEIKKECGKTGVRVRDDRYGRVEVYVMRNGFQWTGFGADKELLVMLRDSIDEYLRSPGLIERHKEK